MDILICHHVDQITLLPENKKQRKIYKIRVFNIVHIKQ